MYPKRVMLTLFFAFLTAAPIAQADAVFFSEGDFTPGSWTATTPFLASPASLGFSYGTTTDRVQAADDFMLHIFELDAPAASFDAVYAPVFFTGFVHDPSTDGAINTISAAVRTFPASAAPAAGGGFGVMRLFLEQDGKYFTLSATSPNFPTNYPEFQGHNVYSTPDTIRNATAVVASDFLEVVPGVGFDNNSLPDFAGSPISFGFGYSMTTTGLAGEGQNFQMAAFDDVSVRLDVVPEPATAGLVGLGALALLRRRRR